MKINILGTEYDLIVDNESNDILLTDKDGYCDESGLSSDICDWHCEEMVDWLAMQSPKIFKLFEELKIM
ncbi:MAG: hypothetical protein LUF02_00440 [Erysipelotrichaceae bacterium]|nr:hypothetical protein [Erysipelotrichaceae bacterium]